MKLAVNFSPQAADLLQAGQIQFDLFKTPNWQDMVSEALSLLPVYVHFDLSVGDGRLANVDWPEVDDFLEKTGTNSINLHVVATPDLNPCDKAQVDHWLDQITDEVKTVCQRYSPERVITENLPLPLSGKNYMRPVAMPTFFQRLVTESGCGMLLDLAHAAITARTLQTEPFSFFSEFPVRRLKEIHVNGLGIHNGEIQDHMEMQDQDWTLFEKVIQSIKIGAWRTPEIVAFEYGGTGSPFIWRSEARVLLQQVPRLHKLVQNGNGRHTPG